MRGTVRGDVEIGVLVPVENMTAISGALKELFPTYEVNSQPDCRSDGRIVLEVSGIATFSAGEESDEVQSIANDVADIVRFYLWPQDRTNDLLVQAYALGSGYFYYNDRSRKAS